MLWTLPVPIIHQKFFLAYANLVVYALLINLIVPAFTILINKTESAKLSGNSQDFIVTS